MSPLEDTDDFPAPVMDIEATVDALVAALDARRGNGANHHRKIIMQALDGADARVQADTLATFARSQNVTPVYRRPSPSVLHTPDCPRNQTGSGLVRTLIQRILGNMGC